MFLRPIFKPCTTVGIFRKIVSVSGFVALAGCNAFPNGGGVAVAQDNSGTESQDPVAQTSENSVAPASMDSQLMYEILIAELAGRRGQLDVAMAGYLRASERTNDPRVSERATRLAIFGRQWAEAENVARRWLRLDPDNIEVAQIIGQTLLRQGKVKQASEHYVALVNASGNKARALLNIQFELQRNEDAQQSLRVMQQVLNKNLNQIEAHLGMARSQLAVNNRQAALDAVVQGLQIAPDNTGALLLQAQILAALGRPEEGFEALTTALEIRPDNVELRLGYAQLLVESRRYDDVGEQLDHLYGTDRDDTDTLLTISLLALDSKRLDRARNYLQELRLSGDYPDQANFYLARISDDQQDYATAIEYYDSVSEGDLQLNARIRAAELTALTGDLAQGRQRLKLTAESVTNPAIQPRLISAESRMLQNAGQPGEAVSVLSSGLEQFPDNSDLLYARALAADSAGNSGLMIEDLTLLIELEPDNAHGLNALGYHYADSNIKLNEADELLVKANTLLPNDPAIIDSLGWLRYRQGKFAEAVTLLKQAYQLYPDAEIAAHLGEVLWVGGEQAQARELLEAALIDSPEDRHLLEIKQKFIE